MFYNMYFSLCLSLSLSVSLSLSLSTYIYKKLDDLIDVDELIDAYMIFLQSNL